MGTLSVGKTLSAEQDHNLDYGTVYEAVKSSKFKKTEFALSVASTKAEWTTPKYIAEGLRWLVEELRATKPNTDQEADA